MRKSIGNRRGEGVALDSLGRVHNEMGRSEKAVQYFEKALAIDQAVGDRGLEGWTLHNLGWTCNRLGQYVKAKDYLEQALDIHQEVGNRRGECRTTRDLGKSSNMLGQKEQGRAYFKRALLISEEIRDPFGKATTLQNAALVYIGQTHYEVALSASSPTGIIRLATSARSSLDGAARFATTTSRPTKRACLLRGPGIS
jgi:tetratricopeptide (TPR) repeat protein